MAEVRDASSNSGSIGNNPSLDLAELLAAIQAAIKAVAAALRSSSLVKWRSPREVATEIFVNYLASAHSVALLVCDEKIIPVESAAGERKYVVCISPLVYEQDTPDPPCVAGTVFSVHKNLDSAQLANSPASGRPAGVGPSLRSVLHAVLQPGRNLVAAGYGLYASSTLLVLSTGPGVHLFVLDPVLGEFILTAANLTIPGRGRVYSVDEGLTYEWGNPVVEYVESKKDPKLGSTYGSHHIGCSVADVHTVLRNGGIYLSPQTRSHPNGKLRLVLEAAPLAHLVCRAGGLATDGHSSLTDCQPEGLGQRTAAFLGSREDVRDLLALFRRNNVLYSSRPSSLRASAASTITPTASSTTTTTSQQPLKVKDKERAEANLTASMAVLSATLLSLRPSSAVYPSSLAPSALTPTVQRPMSAASASTSSVSSANTYSMHRMAKR